MAYGKKEFYKLPKDTGEVTFVLDNLEPGNEVFKVWDNSERRFRSSKEKILSKDGVEYEVEGLKFMRRDEFSELFPGMAKNTQYLRDVTIGGNKYVLPLKKTAEDALQQTIGMVQKLGGNPLKKQFVLKRVGSGLQTQWSIDVGGDAQLPPVENRQPEPTQEQPSQQQSTPHQENPQPTEPVTPTDEEKILIANVKSVGIPVTIEQWKQACSGQGIADARAEALYKELKKD